MGAAMLLAWLQSLPDCTFYIIDRHANSEDFGAPANLNIVRKADEDLKTADLLILAVKPQTMQECADDVRPFLKENTPLLSVAAGLSLQRLQSMFGDEHPVIRTIPNTPSQVQKGMTIAMHTQNIGDDTYKLSQALLDCVGETLWIKDESLFDAMGAVSASGPAYIFYLIEVLTKAGIHAGVPENDAALLARQTVIGSAALAEYSDKLANVLRENVTSKGGMTKAALDVLMDGRLQAIYDDAIKAARDRSRELGQE